MSKQRWKKFELGMSYLEKHGLGLIYWTQDGEKLVFKSGAAFKSLEEETLSKPYKIKLTEDNKIVELTEEFMNRFEISTKLDLQRLMRICSILLTDFSGPIEEDTPKNHLERLKNRLKKYVKNENEQLIQGFLGFEAIMGYKEQIALEDYNQAAKLMNGLYKLW
ncbi:MAG TPA: hypothetical protein VMZ29_11940 [Candidatus Bathyarchaeia archaeon]|nr:hypothetical protein [Candidatus Bathyarchaeia archaeon]